MIKSDKLHRRNLGSSSQPANRNLPLICILLSLIRNIVQCLALLSVNMCDAVTVNGHEQPLTCCKLGRKTWEPLVDLIRCDKVTPRHEQAQTNKIYVQADMQNPAACHTIREFSRVRFFCVSCIKYNDNCYLPFQESSKSDWIVSHSPKSIASEPLAWKAWDHHIHVKTNTWKRSSTIVTANINIKIESRWRSQSDIFATYLVFQYDPENQDGMSRPALSRVVGGGCITFSKYDQTKCDADDRSSLFGDQSDNVEVERVTFTYKTHQNPGEVWLCNEGSHGADRHGSAMWVND